MGKEKKILQQLTKEAIPMANRQKLCTFLPSQKCQ